MAENTEALDIITTAQEAVTPHELHPGIYLDGSAHELIDIRTQIREDAQLPPARKTGNITFTDPIHLVAYLDKHALPQTEVFADDRACTIRAIINAHQGINDAGDAEATAGYGDHTATLAVRKTDDWNDWTKNDAQLLDQVTFAEFIEDHLPNFVTPTGADMLELAQTFQATTKVDFGSSQRLKSGETQLLYQETGTATAGKKGQIPIPDTFTIGLQVFENGEAYKLAARFRYRIHDGNLRLGYRLTRPRDVQRAAFLNVIETVSGGITADVWSI